MGGGSDILSTGGGVSGDTHGLEEEEQEDEDMPIFEKHDSLLHGERITRKFISSIFMKKYIHVARAMKPVLTREACDIISTEYAKLRAQDTTGTDKAKVSWTCVVTAWPLDVPLALENLLCVCVFILDSAFFVCVDPACDCSNSGDVHSTCNITCQSKAEQAS